LFIQKEIEEGRISLVWSFILDYENNANPFPEVRKQISKWKPLASINCQLNEKISSKAASLLEKGLHNKDAAHLACAIEAKADHFLTTDKRVLNKTIPEISILNPIDFVRKYNA
jgi:predicted nucleic acid-binding protein